METGRTYENRPILVAVVASPDRIRNLESVRTRHLKFAGSEAPAPSAEDPAVVWLCYSVHGNEPSGANASLLTLYYLAAGQSERVKATLQNNVILIDPALNPDGLDRFAHWTNTNRSMNPSADPLTREHREAWPGGRTNHYWFDLNRDWLLLTHPESRARVETFQQWKPNVLCDFHEMGTNSTYFFQPGVTARRNPLTPERNEELTAAIAEYHAAALDQEKRLYYSGEQFDDFYYGKGSTYPDAQGCIGILFEQASSRGRRQESTNGVLEFPFTIHNQFTTTLSTLAASTAMREELLEYQGKFFRDARATANAGGYVFGDESDPVRTRRLVTTLLHHDIDVFHLNQDVTVNGQVFSSESGYVVPAKQDQSTLLHGIFEERTVFADSLFYDVSAWTMPHSLGVPFAKIGGAAGLQASPASRVEARTLEYRTLPEAYTYALDWSHFNTPKIVNELLQSRVRVRVAMKPLTAETQDGLVELAQGTILVPMGIQDAPTESVAALLQRFMNSEDITIHALTGGLTPEGPDLGSPNVRALRAPKPLLVVGDGVRSYEAGEVWHLLDERMDMPLSMIERDRLRTRDLDKYTHLILVSGTYRNWDEDWVDGLKSWISRGGVLMAVRSANAFIKDAKLAPLEYYGESEKKDEENPGPPEKRPYHLRSEDSGARVTGGAILEAHLDNTHPIGFGYHRDRIAVFRNSNRNVLRSRNPYRTVAWFTQEPLLAGYVHEDNLIRLPGLASVLTHKLGSGSIICYVDNPNFRGVWDGTAKLFLNGLFMGSLLQ